MSLSRWNQFRIQLIKKYVYVFLAFKANQLTRIRVVIFENITGNFQFVDKDFKISINEWAFLVLEEIQNLTETKRERR